VAAVLSASDASLPAHAPAAAGSARQLFAAAAGLALLSVAALAIDLPVARWVSAHPLPGDIRRLVSLAEVFGWGGTVTLFIVTAMTLDTRGWRVAPRLVFCAWGAGLAADGLKLIGLARWRPSAALAANLTETFTGWLPLLRHERALGSYGHAFQSFPSGHAATATGLAIALSALYPRGRWLFATLACLACLQRAQALAHYPSDILAGAALGCLLGAACSAQGPLQRWLVGFECSR
jgi:membrane-associated phospholipid phosphatase